MILEITSRPDVNAIVTLVFWLMAFPVIIIIFHDFIYYPLLKKIEKKEK